ncbi:MAG: membrane protein insertase YidC [Gemmatimonadota bacterium]
MEKRMILAIVLSIAVLIGYQYYFAPAPQRAPQGTAQPGAAGGGAKDNATPAKPATPAAAPAVGAAPPVSPLPAARAMGPGRENPVRWIVVKTPRYTATVSTEGGGIESFLLADYKDVPGPAGRPLDIIGARAARPLPLSLDLSESQPAFPASPVYASDAPATIDVAAGEKRSVVLSWASAGGVAISREYVFTGGRYDFEVRAQVTNGSKAPLKWRPGLDLSQVFEPDYGGDSYSFKGVVVEAGKKIERHDLKAIAKGKVGREPVRWAAADAKYFSLIVIPEKEWTLQSVGLLGEDGVRLTVSGAPAIVAPGESVRIAAKAFMGPKEYNLLEKTGDNLEQLVDYGWFSFLAKPLVWFMEVTNRVTHNYGIDIIILTILIKILFYPLTQRSLASMKKMQELGPIMAKLKEKYKDDRNRLNQETMNLYKTYNINPLSGCLPMVLQIPVFIALYKGLLVAIELRHAPFFLWIHDLSAPEHLWNVELLGYTIPIRILPLLMGISMFVQQKMTPSGGMEPAQQKVMLLLPVLFTFMFWGFPTGLVIYWLVNNVLQIGQQLIHQRQAEAAKAAKP